MCFKTYMDLYDYKTVVLETNAMYTQSFDHCACSDAIIRYLTMLSVATLTDTNIALRYRKANRVLLSSYTAQCIRDSLKEPTTTVENNLKVWKSTSASCTFWSLCFDFFSLYYLPAQTQNDYGTYT